MFVTSLLLLAGTALSITASLEFVRPLRSSDPFVG